ncbi:MAG: hypothetical protein ACK2UK_13910, partial [Candidatus Promineifilaceae bacterium]
MKILLISLSGPIKFPESLRKPAVVRIPAKTITFSGACRSRRPDDADHLFRRMAIAREQDNAGSKIIPSAILCDQR